MDIESYNDSYNIPPPNDDSSFQAHKDLYSINQLYAFLEDITEAKTTSTKSIITRLYYIKEKIIKNDILIVEFIKWFKEFLFQTSDIFNENPSIISALSDIFFVLFSSDDREADSLFINLMDYSLGCCLMAIKIFGIYIKHNLKLEPYDRTIHKIFKYLPNLDLRPTCLSIIRESLTNSLYLYKSINPSKEQLTFLSVLDDPTSISNGLEICKQMIEAPRQKFPSNGYEFFFSEVMKAIIFFSHEKIISDIIILQISEISLLFKSIDFFYLMDPNDFLFSWLSSIFYISERFINLNQAINNDLDHYLKLVNNLIKFWLLPPNLLKIQETPEFNKWKDDFVSLCMLFFLKHSSNKSKKIIVEIMKDQSFCVLLGQHFASVRNFKSIIHHQIKNHPRDVGNCVLISIFASVLNEREFIIDNGRFKKYDIRALNHIIKYYINFPLTKPETDDQFLYSDALSRVLYSFSNTYLNKGKIFINDEVMQNVSVLYFRTLVNLQATDKSIDRLDRGINAILNLPFDIVVNLSNRTEFVPIVSSLKFDYLHDKQYRKQVEKIFNHLFSIHNEDLDKSLLSSIDIAYSTDLISRNLFAAIQCFFRNCIDEDHNRIMQIVMPIIQKAIHSQIYLDEVAKTVETISEKVFHPKCQSLSPETIDYVKMIIIIVHILLEQFASAELNEEDTIAQKVLNVFNNLLVRQPINFGFLAFYGDFCFQQIIDEFFSLLSTKDALFFCQDSDFVVSLIQFLDSFIDAGLVHDNVFNYISVIFSTIFDIHKIGQDILAKLSTIMMTLIEKGYKLEGVLQSILKYKISEEPSLFIFNKVVIFLCRIHFDVFYNFFKGNENSLSEDANELLQYIFSELGSEIFEFSSQFESNFNDCFEMIKPVLISVLFDDNDNLKIEEDFEP